MKTVVTGAAGFIGANLVRRLIKDSREIRAIDNVSRGSGKNLAELPIETMHADLRSYEQTLQAIEGADCVYHLAARAIDANVFRACVEKSVEKIVYIQNLPDLQFWECESVLSAKMLWLDCA